ncbi:Tim10/DDP family zinc finger-domain-containing protein [Mycotypha africana]|uniref:Tim10/DDP family zinc finger-domain-containing protein n=1 Tax=Mycotypha africana TaxID=64632 RepID=UPI002300F180|nr:Tim10/DDP family zinc finger-domain-containing protein [Mycotypha africana]KAI8987479.1 Tim10/DDP family zinc finger-domain-containing protein [Mycotypha africana]
MSYYSSFAQTYVDPQHLQEAEQQVDAFMGMIMTACQDKCIPTKYHEPDLNKGEQKCIDRCVAKYMSIQKIMSERMKHMVPNVGSDQ